MILGFFPSYYTCENQIKQQLLQCLKNCIMLLKWKLFFHSVNIHLAPTTCQALVLLPLTSQMNIIYLRTRNQSASTDQHKQKQPAESRHKENSYKLEVWLILFWGNIICGQVDGQFNFPLDFTSLLLLFWTPKSIQINNLNKGIVKA